MRAPVCPTIACHSEQNIGVRAGFEQQAANHRVGIMAFVTQQFFQITDGFLVFG